MCQYIYVCDVSTFKNQTASVEQMTHAPHGSNYSGFQFIGTNCLKTFYPYRVLLKNYA